MKYFIYQILAVIPFAFVIILTKEISGLFGFVTGAALVMYSYLAHYLMNKRDEDEADREYKVWQAETDARYKSLRADIDKGIIHKGEVW